MVSPLSHMRMLLHSPTAFEAPYIEKLDKKVFLCSKNIIHLVHISITAENSNQSLILLLTKIPNVPSGTGFYYFSHHCYRVSLKIIFYLSEIAMKLR